MGGGGNREEKKVPHPHPLPPAPRGRGRVVAPRTRHGHGDDSHRHDDQEGVEDPAWKIRLPEEQLHVFERGRVVEDPGDVAQIGRAHVQIAVLLERRNEHPVEREPGEDHEAERRSVQRHTLHCAPPTSVRWASRSIAMATTIRKGGRNTAIAAPCPKSAPKIPRWNASVGSTCVVLAGPPPVRMYTTPRSVAVYTTPNSTATATTGSSNGNSTWNKRRQNPAPSTTAASTISCGIDASPASTITVAKGKIRQACTMMMAVRASPRAPSQYSQPCSSPEALSVQLITLKGESKIHVHAIAASDTGTTQGKRSTNRAKRFPRNVARNTWAAAVARMTTSSCVPTVTTALLRRARRKIGSPRIAA